MALTPQEKAELEALEAKNRSTTRTASQPASKKSDFLRKAGALTYGGVTGLVGGLGELEKLGQKASEYVVPRSPTETKGVFGRETLFPTVKEAQQALSAVGISPPEEDVSGYQTAGEFIGGFGPSLPGAFRKAVGVGSKVTERLAREAEKIGFRISPQQVREINPRAAHGASGYAEHNQDLANKLVTRGTGREVDAIDKPFIRERLQTLGAGFDDVYRGRSFSVDQNAMDAIRQISAIEQAAPGFAAVTPVKQAADEILRANADLLRRTKGEGTQFSISGEGLQKLRNALMQRARSSESRAAAHEIYDLIDVIDGSIARNHPDVAKALDILRPQYRNTVILEDLMRQKGIRGGNVSLEQLGNMLVGKREGVRRTGMDIDNLGDLGRELQMRALWEGVGAKSGAPSTKTEAIRRVVSAPLQTATVRAVQRVVPRAAPTASRAVGPAAGTAAGSAAYQTKKALGMNQEGG